MGSSFKQVEITGGPFDPGGQPGLDSRQPLELGFFAWNIRGGLTMSKAVLDDPARRQDFWVWENASRLVRLAEEIGFDYQVPFGKWIGNGGESDFNGASLDFLGSAAATAAITSRIGIFSTVHVTYRFHPLHIAKFGATIDHISGGRWGLNVVSGYSPPEMAAFGFPEPIGHDEAYDIADEFTTLMKHLWAEDERFDFDGKYFQAHGAIIAPRPARRPVLMSAGGSPKGLDFAAKHTEWVFTYGHSWEDLKTRVADLHARAAAYGRRVRASTNSWCLVEATDELAREREAEVVEKMDVDAIRDFLVGAAGNSSAREGMDLGDPYLGYGKEFFERMSAGFGAPRLVGSPETVAEQIRAYKDAGVESLLIVFYDPQKGLHHMQDDVFPILKRMGIRR